MLSIASKPPWNINVQRLLPWLIVLAGLGAMYVPSFNFLFREVWSTEQQAHGPIVLGIAIWLLHRKWPEIMAAPVSPMRVAGPIVFVLGLCFYILGRSQDILLLEVGSLIWILIAILLIFRGRDAVKAGWFAFFFMMFMVPLPPEIVDAATQPMKMAVSYVAEQVLFAVGYPIARSGVILQIGQYQLLVADACAGLHTLFTLEALGLLYLNLVRHESLARNVLLAILIVPISFTANVIRVMVLTLITYHFGDDAGQGFLHGFAGMVLFLAALILIIGVDSLLRILVGRHQTHPTVREGAE
ncbi:exosortase B [Uliginosibacterium sp. H3]|uniref:Exosortase B n=1 Tax=Uliginosibacterium silvisoli TaxID=3114758 RepID=A0ABU6JYK6_9RHOO|nr:exosortase B [Uliginosibacterium sp. H3]